ASFCAISADHPLATELAKNWPEVAEFIAQVHRDGTTQEAIERAEKRGFDTRITAQHPLVANRQLPVYVANFVLMDYGTGAIFGCPAHDQRDLDFAYKYHLAVRPVVVPEDADPKTYRIASQAYTGPGRLANSDFLDGLGITEAKIRIAEVLIARTVNGKPQARTAVNYRLRDWGISRQRYWGCPIPVIHCDSCAVVPVPRADLPVTLPADVTFDKPGNPLDRHPTWSKVDCPQCGKPGRRDVDRGASRFLG
ncbi:MAG: leucine--tRNA ligase, partial [Hyphomicrobiales bacterium]